MSRTRVWKPVETWIARYIQNRGAQGLSTTCGEDCGGRWRSEKPYRGAEPALTDMLGGQVQVMFDNAASSTEHIRAGRLHALAVTTARRMDAFPDLPAVGEFVPGYEASNLNGIGVPAKTPPEIITRLNAELNTVLAEPMTKVRFAELGGAAMIGSPADYGTFLADETKKWAKVVKAAGLTAG